MNFIEGEILSVDKPYGWTSFDAVKRIRGALVRRIGLKKLKVGHAGTLDPLATGVMIICTGRATKRIDSLQAGVKEYIAEVALGATTPSYDLETEVDALFPTGHITRSLVDSVLSSFVGVIRQTPPAYSAVKVDGKRAYESARKGKEVVLKPKTLVIDEIELMEFSPELIKIRVVCSKGTYIRALARDIGLALGSGAHLKS
ncbi:MAG: tRNA pseudouridine(55) synthase TruB, partial [Muribaculaceae bacterium]|nr:tRNA pseudouridine(55) synthase TruB [Muribaculaceae bacterium]